MPLSSSITRGALRNWIYNWLYVKLKISFVLEESVAEFSGGTCIELVP